MGKLHGKASLRMTICNLARHLGVHIYEQKQGQSGQVGVCALTRMAAYLHVVVLALGKVRGRGWPLYAKTSTVLTIIRC